MDSYNQLLEGIVSATKVNSLAANVLTPCGVICRSR